MVVQSNTVIFRCMEKKEMYDRGHDWAPAPSKMSTLKLSRL